MEDEDEGIEEEHAQDLKILKRIGIYGLDQERNGEE